jgi:hypothetical protein
MRWLARRLRFAALLTRRTVPSASRRRRPPSACPTSPASRAPSDSASQREPDGSSAPRVRSFGRCLSVGLAIGNSGGTRIAILGTLIAILGTRIAILGTRIAIIGTLIAIIGLGLTAIPVAVITRRGNRFLSAACGLFVAWVREVPSGHVAGRSRARFAAARSFVCLFV